MGELVDVASIKVGKRFRTDLGDLDSLMESIQKVGLISPIAIDEKHVLIAGQRRLEAVKRLGWDVVEVVVVDGSQPLASEHDENVVRKDFTPSERKAITEALLEREKVAAAERKRAGGEAGRRARNGLGTAVAKPTRRNTGGRASEAAANQAGWSGKSYERFSEIQAAFEANPDNPAVREIYEAVERGEIGVKTGQKRLVLAGVLASAAAEFQDRPAPHMGLSKKSSKSNAARLLKIAEALAGYATALPSFNLEGGEADNDVLEQMLRDLTVIRAQVRRLQTQGGEHVR